MSSERDHRLAAVKSLVENAVKNAHDSFNRPTYQGLLDEVRTKHYDDYSLWDAEFDMVEQVVVRVLAEMDNR